MAGSEWTERFLSTSRGAVVSRLRRGASTADELAQDLGITASGVRSHLATLERDGWVVAGGTRRDGGVGKPATEYELAPGAEHRLSSAYRPVLVSLLAALGEREDARSRRRLYREAGARLAKTVRGGRAALGPAEAVAVLTDLGAVVTVDRLNGSRLVLQGSGCPVGEAVAEEPESCHLLAALIEGLTDRTTTAACQHQPKPCCRFRVE